MKNTVENQSFSVCVAGIDQFSVRGNLGTADSEGFVVSEVSGNLQTSATLNVPALESSPETETLAKDAFPLSEFLNTPALFSNEALTVPLFSKTACALLVKTLLLVSPSLWNEPSLIVSDSAEVSKRAFALLETVPCWTKEAAVPALSSSSSFPLFVRVPFLLTLRILTCSKALEAMSALPLKSTFQTANSPFLRFNEPFFGVRLS